MVFRKEWLKPAVFALLGLPLAYLAIRWIQFTASGGESRALTAEPVAYTINFLGIGALRCLLLALAITPIDRLTGWTPLMTLRRMVGLFAFTYALVHLTVYFVLDLGGLVTELIREVAAHPFILLGMAAFLLLLPLALTSTRAWVRRLGARNWQRLHRAAYLTGVLGAAHYIYRVKGFELAPYAYAAGLAGLLALRLLPRRKGGYLGLRARRIGVTGHSGHSVSRLVGDAS